jgi:hypothetical protein
MIWQCGATVTCANDGLIMLNKFVSRFQTSYIISFFISIW